MKVGWNRQYILHCLACEDWLSKSSRLLILTGLLSSFVFAFPVTTGVFAGSDLAARPAERRASPVKAQAPAAEEESVLVTRMLARHGVDPEHLPRVAQAILASGAKYKVDPRLVASIVIVESRANPFAVSSSDSVGIMQIHLGTWGKVADRENVNLFKIEDNIDFGVRILRDYIRTNGFWGGVARYHGWIDTPESQVGAQEYVRKVQRIYGVSSDSPTL
jgi:soluble lytic murein transglycosylase-like protein